MKLYQTSGYEQDSSTDANARWSGALAAASKDRVAMKKEGFKNIDTVEYDVPTNKADLLVWLNENHVSV